MSEMRKRIQSESGLSLIEILFSLGMFLLVAVAISGATTSVIRANATSRDTSAATALLQDKIEFFRALDPDTAAFDAALVNGTETVDEMGDTAGDKYTRAWTINNMDALGMYGVTVSVAWLGPDAQAVQGVAYVCKRTSCM